MQYTYWDIFSHGSKQFLNSSILKHFSDSAIVCCTSSTSAKHFPLRTFFILGNKQTKKALRAKLGEQGGWRTEVMLFLFQNFWTFSVVWAGVLVNHPSWNELMHWKSLQKNSLKPMSGSHNSASWYSDTDGFLEHPPSKGSLYYKGPTLQKIIPVCLWSLLVCIYEIMKRAMNSPSVACFSASVFLSSNMFSAFGKLPLSHYWLCDVGGIF